MPIASSCSFFFCRGVVHREWAVQWAVLLWNRSREAPAWVLRSPRCFSVQARGGVAGHTHSAPLLKIRPAWPSTDSPQGSPPHPPHAPAPPAARCRATAPAAPSQPVPAIGTRRTSKNSPHAVRQRGAPRASSPTPPSPRRIPHCSNTLMLHARRARHVRQARYQLLRRRLGGTARHAAQPVTQRVGSHVLPVLNVSRPRPPLCPGPWSCGENLERSTSQASASTSTLSTMT